MTLIFLTALLACSKQETSTSTTNTSHYATPIKPSKPGEVTKLTENDAVVAEWSTGKVKYGDLSNSLNNKLKQMEAEYLTNRYNFEKSALVEKVLKTVLEEEAKAKGHSDMNALLKASIAEPTADAIQAYFDKALAENPRLRGAKLEDVKDQIIQVLQEEDQAKFLSEIKEKYKVSINLPFPNVPRIDVSVDDDPMLGNKDAAVTIVQFAEYQCPYCGKAGEVVDKILKEYEGKVNMVFRDFPLGFHDRAVPAAVAANCAGEQNKYWEMHKKLMADQSALDEATLKAHAEAIGLNIATWETCLQDPKQAQEVNNDAKDGAELGVSGTPAFFVNGIFFSGALPYEQFKEIIDRELQLQPSE